MQLKVEGANVYDYFKGTVISLDGEAAIIEIGGIGYRLLVPVSLVGTVPIGEKMLLYTSWVVREQSQTLFGFATKEERDLFELLITISGVGPKTALNLLGRLPPDQLATVVETEDASALARVPGIGKKTAERVLIDLKGKQFSKTPMKKTVNEALQALMNLGMSRSSAEKAVKKASEMVDPDNLSALISTALSL
ncbi:MAG: Holliday junction ATP-dependent DNA helicase RuvA [Chlamydiales bacterium]|nr:Holliday junction ATP-dependent DNA helicase RuvA [Chlamydiales bacterium]MCH9619402.1 Holliday junction ATP-dependent DNA helicase RuvA [Chlamydiales bacterium]MCH9622206.1 Holliday junction ATP-dependent DNA helicase RuvA [Chlamydiales bacterium]